MKKSRFSESKMKRIRDFLSRKSAAQAEISVKIGWLSDIHLNFLEDAEVSSFINELAAVEVDGWVVSGDIGESGSIRDYLGRLSSGLGRPVYFVLGNHDYYHSSIAEVASLIDSAVLDSGLIWLTSSGPSLLNGDFAIVGDDGWGDARLGDPHGSHVELNDFYCIRDLMNLTRTELIQKTNALGDACFSRLAPKLEDAASRCSKVCVITHVPPYEGAAWYEGQPSGPEWLPWFSCAAAGRAIFECAGRHADVDFVVLCGHTHGQGIFKAYHNVIVYTAGAEYGRPELQGIVICDGDKLAVRSKHRQ